MSTLEQQYNLTPEEMYAINSGLSGEDFVNALLQFATNEVSE